MAGIGCASIWHAAVLGLILRSDNILFVKKLAGEETFLCPNMLSLVSCAGTTLNKCAILRIGMSTGSPLCRESHPLCTLKNPSVVYMITCRLKRGCSSMYRKKEKERKGILVLSGIRSFKHACEATQKGQRCETLTKAFFSSMYCEQRRLWQDAGCTGSPEPLLFDYDMSLLYFFLLGPVAKSNAMSACCSDGHRFNLRGLQNILSLRLVMKSFLQPFSPYLKLK